MLCPFPAQSSDLFLRLLIWLLPDRPELRDPSDWTLCARQREVGTGKVQGQGTVERDHGGD